MSLYRRFILPPIVHFVCRSKPATLQRKKIVPLATGRVLEIGFGSGLNLPFYDASRVSHLWALEPSREMWNLASEQVRKATPPVEFMQASSEAIPLESGSVDTVLVTYTLCTIPDAAAALGEMRRVLKPDGVFLFCEHGEAPDENARRWQRRLNPVWNRLSGGCNLGRPIPSLIEENGFGIRDLSTMYLPGWRPASFNYWGTAVTR